MRTDDEDFQEILFDDETDFALQERDDKKPTLDSSDIPTEIMRDSVKLLIKLRLSILKNYLWQQLKLKTWTI